MCTNTYVPSFFPNLTLFPCLPKLTGPPYQSIILSEHLSLPRIVQAFGFTLYLEVDFWSQSVMLPAERPRLTWTIPTLDTQLPAWQSWDSRTFVIAPALSTRPHPSLFSPVVLKSFLWVWNKKYFVTLSSINTHAQAVEIYYCLFSARI